MTNSAALVQNGHWVYGVAVFVDCEVQVRAGTQAGTSYKTNLGFLSVYEVAFCTGNLAHVAVECFIA